LIEGVRYDLFNIKVVYMSYEGGNLAYVFISYLYCVTIYAATEH